MKLDPKTLMRALVFGLLLMGIAAFGIFRILRSESPSPVKQAVITETVRLSQNIFPLQNVNALSVKLAVRLMDNKDYAGARKVFEEILVTEPTNSSILNNLAFIAGEEGNLEKAAEYLRTAVQVNPDCAECQNNLGNIFYRQGKGAAAKPYFEKAASLKPDYLDPCLNLAVVFEEEGDWQKAFDWYRKADAKATDAELKSAISSRTAWMAEITQNQKRHLAGDK